MFQPKEPFGGQETIDACLIETSDEGTSVLSPQFVKFAKDRPDDFANYLLRACERDGAVIRKHKELLEALKNVEAFLRDDVKVEATDDEWFYLSLLHYVQTQNSDGKVEFPRRVLELYLRLQAVSEAGGAKVRVKIRNWLREQPLILTPSGWKTARIPKTDIKVAYLKLVHFDHRMMLDPYDSLDEKIKRLLIQLSERLPKFGYLIDKEDLDEKKIFPVYGKDKRVRLFPVSKLFYIIDKEYLHHSFRGKVDVLDIDHTTFWLLEPFFIWMGLQSRYLRNNLIMEPASITPGVVNYKSIPTLEQERVDGLLRLAVHFRSSRTRNAEEIASVERQLRLTKICYVDEGDIKCTVFIKGYPSTIYETPFPPFCINKRRNNGLNIYVAKKSAEVTTSVELPRSLAAWLMADRDHRHPDATQVDPRLIYLVGTILRVKHYKLSAIKDILDGEGVVDVDKLQCSIYHPQSQKKKSPQLFSAQPPSLVSSRSTLDSSRTSTPAQVDDLTRHTASFIFGGNWDNSGFGVTNL
ncbi:hypothetical protein FDENT_5281 [Fusarium denticulatum]|uniref:Uncharacterized protein n=1 Tax=Fusarium denticulatum TaxID=48507 RepID=A0A8H5UBN6_9HYPO|nr:hypothetical protein FDENT_5281 [Fusarium denticulatum]